MKLKFRLIMNSFLKLVVRGCPLDAPFHPNEKCDANSGGLDASALGGLLTFASSLFNNATNVGLTTATNAANERMNQLNVKLGLKNMQQQKELFNQSLEYQTDMWNKQNAYNNPSAQVGRLLAAGINPAMMFGQTTPASSVSSPSAPSTHAPQATFAMQSPQVDFSGVGSAVYQSLAMRQQIAKTDSEINYTNAKAEFEWRSMLSRLQQEVNSAEKGSVEWQQAQENLRLFKDTYSAQKLAIVNNAAITQKDIEKLEMDIASQRIQNVILQSDADWRPKINEANWQALKIGIREAAARIENYGRDSALKAAQTAVERARKDGMEISNEQADQLVEVIVDAAEANLVETERDVYAGKFAGKYLPAPDTHQRANEKKHRQARERRKRSRIDRL